jgi:hypothetical protein
MYEMVQILCKMVQVIAPQKARRKESHLFHKDFHTSVENSAVFYSHQLMGSGDPFC